MRAYSITQHGDSDRKGGTDFNVKGGATLGSAGGIVRIPQLEPATTAGAQVYDLPPGATGVLDMGVKEAIGPSYRALDPDHCTVANDKLYVDADAGVRVGDVVKGFCFSNSSTGGGGTDPAPSSSYMQPGYVESGYVE